MSDSGKAVFLSYASQDAEAAKRIADALRAAGVEVWFDAEGGLEHGDAWDAKIRRQIKECVLFIPLISANTQEREEGYFRLEWDLAAERSRTIATGVAFILPVLIDATREPDALVPDRFRTVQWTKLPGGVVPPEVLQRFLKLWSHRTGALKHGVENREQRSEDRGQGGDGEAGHPRSAGPGWKVYAGLVAACFAIAAGAFAWLSRKPATLPAQTATASTVSAPVASVTEFPRDPELAKAVKLTETINSTMEDHTLAEDLAKAVLARKPTDPETVIVNAYVANRFIMRGFDVSEERHAMARRLCERAVLLAPDHPEALHVLGQFLIFRGADLPRAVELLRRALTSQPGRARYYNSYIEAMEALDPKEAIRVAEDAAARFPTDAIIHYRLALTRAYSLGDIDGYERALDETLAIAPVATAVIRKAGILLMVHRDVAAAKRMLDRMPENFRTNDRTVYARYLLASISGQVDDLDDALRALNALPGNFLNDFGLWPKRMLTGDLLARRGQNDLARREFEGALADIARERARNPNARIERPEKWLLLWLGREQEAKASANLTYEGTRRPYSLRGFSNLWFDPVSTLLVLGERAKALELLREAASEDWGRRMSTGAFALNPHLAPWRDDAEIRAILAPAKTESSFAMASSIAKAMEDKSGLASLPDSKSVAVLAFTNLSDDKANEYFSDGISEELLNVLAKVPGLKVSARTSAFYFKGKEVPIPEIARQLGVAYVVEGSVRKQGNQVRIAAQLIKADGGFHVWSDTFTRDLKDIFAVQDEIAGLVAQQLQLKLGHPSRTAHVVNPEAFRLYLEGRQEWSRRLPAAVARAEELFKQSIALDPEFGRAHAGLADVWAIRANIKRRNNEDAGQELSLANAALDRALQIDPDLAEAHATRANLYAMEGRVAEAMPSFKRALALNPSYASAHQWYGRLLFDSGSLDAGLAELEIAVRLDPLSPIIASNQAMYLGFARRWTESLAAADRALSIRPNGDQAFAVRINALLGLGRRDEALAELRARNGVPSGDQPELVADPFWRAVLLAQAGDHAAAAKFADLVLAAKAEAGSGPQIFFLYLALGRPGDAFAHAQQVKLRLPPEAYAYLDPVYDAVRDDPRFLRLLDEAGILDKYRDNWAQYLAWKKRTTRP